MVSECQVCKRVDVLIPEIPSHRKMDLNQIKAVALRQGQTCRVIMKDVLENIIMDKKPGAGWIELFETGTKASCRKLLAETRKSLSTIAIKKNSMIRCYLPNSIHKISIKNKSEIINNRIQNIDSTATIQTVDITDEMEDDEVDNSSLPVDPVLGIRVIQIGERDQRDIANARRSTTHIITNLNKEEICKDDSNIVDTFEISDNEYDQINKLGANFNKVIDAGPSVLHYTFPVVDLIEDDTQTKEKCLTRSKRAPQRVSTMKDEQRKMFIDFISNPNSSRIQPESNQIDISNETINVPDDSDITDNTRQVENLTGQHITFSLADVFHRISPICEIVDKNHSPSQNDINSSKVNIKEIVPPLAVEIQELGMIPWSDNNLEPEDAIYIADSPESPSFVCAVCHLSFSEQEQLESHKKIHSSKNNSDGQTFIISNVGTVVGEINTISSSSEVIPALTKISSEINKSNIIPGLCNSSGLIPIKLRSPFQINNPNIKPGVYIIKGNEINEVGTNYTIHNSDERFKRDNTRPISPKVLNSSKEDCVVVHDKPVPKKNSSPLKGVTTWRNILPKYNHIIKSKTGRSTRIDHQLVPRSNLHANLSRQSINCIPKIQEVPKEIKLPSVRCKSLNLLTDNTQSLMAQPLQCKHNDTDNRKYYTLLTKKNAKPSDQVNRQMYENKVGVLDDSHIQLIPLGNENSDRNSALAVDSQSLLAQPLQCKRNDTDKSKYYKLIAKKNAKPSDQVNRQTYENKVGVLDDSHIQLIPLGNENSDRNSALAVDSQSLLAQPLQCKRNDTDKSKYYKLITKKNAKPSDQVNRQTYENKVGVLDESHIQLIPLGNENFDRNSALVMDSDSVLAQPLQCKSNDIDKSKYYKLLAKKNSTPADQVRRQKYRKKSSKNLKDKNTKDPSHSPVKLITVAPVKKNTEDSSSKHENTMKIFRNDICDNNKESWIPKITTVMSLNDQEQNSEIIKSINEVAKVVKHYDVSQRDDAGDIESELPLSMILKK